MGFKNIILEKIIFMGSNFFKVIGIFYWMNEFLYRNFNFDMIKKFLRIYNFIGRNFYEKLLVWN